MPMQLVLLSTTLPPTIIPKLMDFYHLLSNTTIIQQLANRPELIYILKKKMSSTSLLAQTVQILNKERL